MKQNFIKTSDLETAQELRRANLTELPKQGNFFVFLNNATAQFSEQTNKQIVYTNTMNM